MYGGKFMNRLSVTAVLIGSLLTIGGADGSGRARPAEPDAQVHTDTYSVHSDHSDSGARPTRAARLRGLPPQLDFRATTLEGQPFTGANLAERPVVFWFWAPSCGACATQAAAVARATKRYGDRVGFVGIGGLDSSAGRLRQFVSRTGTGGITQLDDRAGRLYSRFGVTAPATFLFLTRSGEASSTAGPDSAATLHSHVRSLAGGG
jgi:thiol-disulfide isomerase/thioredoxin